MRKRNGSHVVDQVADPNGPLQAGDVVVAIDRKPVAPLTEVGLGYALLAATPGNHVVEIVRAGRALTATLCLEACGGG